MEPHPRNTTAITIGIIVLVLAIAGGVSLLNKKSDDSTVATDSTATPATVASTATPVGTDSAASPESTDTSAYKDGTYTATGSYSTPGGTEKIELTLTLVGDVVTSSNVVSEAISSDAKGFQAEFIGSYKSQVVGKKIDSLNLSKVSGSSLTSKGFNSAVSSIKSQAS